MQRDVERKLWQIGKEPGRYDLKIWRQIIDELVDDFQVFIGQKFDREPEISLDLENPRSPSFCLWLWSQEKERSLFSPIYLAVMGGEIVGEEKNGKIWDIFAVSLTLFLFDITTQQCLCLITGESIV